MKTKIALEPATEVEADGYRETVAAYELAGTLVVLTAAYQDGKFLAHTIRKGTMSALRNRIGDGPHAVTADDVRIVTEKVFQDDMRTMPGQLPSRVQVVFQERAMEFLDAAGASSHVKLRFAQRISA